MRSIKSILALPRIVQAILVTLALLSSQARAAITVQDTTGGLAYSNSVAINRTANVSSGSSVLVVLVAYKVNAYADYSDADPMTWNPPGQPSQAITRAVVECANNSSYRAVAVYYLFNPTPGTGGTVTGAIQNGNGDTWFSTYTLNGVNTSVVPLTNSANATSASSVNFTIAGVPAGGLAAISAMDGGGGNTLTGYTASPGGNTPVQWQDPAKTTSCQPDQGYLSGLTGGSTAFTFTMSASTKIAISAAVFTPGTTTAFVSPGQTNAECGGTVTFTANPAGTNAPFSFQWYDNQTNLMMGQTNITLTLTNVHPDNAGNYAADIDDGLGSNSTAIATLTVVDTKPPVITLNGSNSMTVDRYSTFTDPGAIAVDGCAGPESVNVVGSVDTQTLGAYTLTYTANDGNGNNAVVTRTVNVVAHPYISECISTGTNWMICGTNGIEGGTYCILSSTNLALPFSQWVPEATNQFDSSGNFSFTIQPDSGVSAKFFVVASLNSSGFAPQNLLVLPQSETETTMALLWDKPDNYDNVAGYEVYQNGVLAATTSPGQTFYCATNLAPGTSYSFYVVAVDTNNNLSTPSTTVSASTWAAGVVLDVSAPPYNAKGDGITTNTAAIQQAINDCPSGGTVEIPAGTFLTAPLVLKSNMAFYVAAGGILQGTTNASDYSPRILSRSMGVESNVFQPLIRIGTMDHNAGYTCGNVTLYGDGEIIGGGNALQNSENDYDYMSRLVLIQNCQNVAVMGLHLVNPVQWTIHPIYSDNITVLNVWIESWQQQESGDGFDPDSSTDCYLVNSLLHTYDNAFSPKSGRTLQGYQIGRPTQHVRAVGCTFEGGSPCLGSECSGGLDDIVIRDSTFQGTTIQFRTSESRGAYMSNFTMADDVFTSGSSSQSIYFWTSCPYRTNAPWAPPPDTIITNFLFKNITGMGGIYMDGTFGLTNGPPLISYIQNTVFTNCTMANGKSIFMEYCNGIQYNNVRHIDGTLPAISFAGTNYNIFRDNVALSP